MGAPIKCPHCGGTGLSPDNPLVGCGPCKARPRVPNGYQLDGDTHVLEPLKIWRAGALASDVPLSPVFTEAPGFTRRLDRVLLG